MSGDIARLRSGTSTNREEINRILNAIQEMNPKSERDALKEFIAFSPVVRLRTTTVTTGNAQTYNTDTRNRETQHMIRKKPTTSKSYPLTHTTTGTISWQASGHKLGGNGILSGSSYITVTTHSRLNVTDKITIALWFKSPATSSDNILVRKNNQYELKLTSGNGISWRVYSSGAWKTALTSTFTTNTWTHVVATYKSTSSGQKLYKNGSSVATDSETGSIATSSNNLGIGSDAGTSTAQANTTLAWFTMLNEEVSSTWVTNFYTSNIIDTSSTNTEILTIPFVGNEGPKPNATSGLCRST